MASTQPTTVVARLLDDDYIHEQIGAAGQGMRDAYRRVRRLPPEKAVQDKTLYNHIRQTATGLSEAARRALDKPEPKRAKGRRGLVLLVLLATGAVVFWSAKNQNRTPERAVALADAPVYPPTTPAA